MEKATFKQTAVIWKFCGQYGDKNADWAKLAKEGAFNKQWASDLIGMIIKWKENGGGADLHTQITDKIQEHIEGFQIVKMPDCVMDQSDNDGQDYAPPPVAKGSNTLDQLLQAMEALLNRDAIGSLKEAIEQERENIAVKYTDQLAHAQKAQHDLEKEIERLKEQGSLPVLEPLTEDYIKHEKFDMVACLVKAKQNVLMTGPAGTGKSRMAREVSLSLALPYHTLSLGGGMRYSQVYGTTHLDNGKSEWLPAPFLQWVQEPGVVILEEIFGADPDVLLGMNQLLEPSTREISTPAGTIEVHPECRFIACANTTGRSVSRQYSGAQRADDSLLSRFAAKVFIDYDANVEEKILDQIQDGKVRDYFLQMLRELRSKIREFNIAFDAGTRELISAIGNYAAGLPYKVAFEVAFLGGLSNAERAKLGV